VAQCILDSGNVVGNFVSREWLENVLEYPKSKLLSLLDYEQRGQIGTSGPVLNPEAAVYLTWYHKKSSRVYHNMRFFVSPSLNHDLVIGAGSMKQHGMLDWLAFEGMNSCPDSKSESLFVRSGSFYNRS
jgi:hypothetical protein